MDTIHELFAFVHEPHEFLTTLALLISELSRNTRFFLRPSFCGILLYIILQQTLRRPLQQAGLYKRSPDGWKTTMFIYNVAMLVFSFLTFLMLCCTVFSRPHVLDGKEWEDTWHTIAMDGFYWSKYVEFVDTFFLILCCKEVSWLHYLHHIGAPLAWGICSLHKVPGGWIPTMFNAFIHTLMYAYYTFMTLKWSFPIPKTLITCLQIFQLLGASLLWTIFYGRGGESSSKLTRIGGFIGVAYGLMCCVFFFNFFYVNYIRKRSRTPKGEEDTKKKIR